MKFEAGIILKLFLSTNGVASPESQRNIFKYLLVSCVFFLYKKTSFT